jgi:hypothetical protein
MYEINITQTGSFLSKVYIITDINNLAIITDIIEKLNELEQAQTDLRKEV